MVEERRRDDLERSIQHSLSPLQYEGNPDRKSSLSQLSSTISGNSNITNILFRYSSFIVFHLSHRTSSTYTTRFECRL